jgi:flagellin-like protein
MEVITMDRRVFRKAEMGVGTLIVFIAMLLVAAVAAGVLITTASSLQEKSLATGQQAKSQISTNVRVIEVSATDGTDSYLNDFEEIVKLSPGSDPIKLDQVIFTVSTVNDTATLKYRGPEGLCIQANGNGYNTWSEEEIDEDVGTANNNYTLNDDLDDDGLDDYIFHNDTHIKVNLSSQPSLLWNVSMGCDLDITAPATDERCELEDGRIGNSTDIYGYVDLVGGTDTNHSIMSNMTFKVTPYNEGEGYFTAVYQQEGTNHIDGNLQRGDLIKICFESPRDIGQDESLRLNFIPKVGTPTYTEAYTPDVISTNRVYLYP